MHHLLDRRFRHRRHQRLLHAGGRRHEVCGARSREGRAAADVAPGKHAARHDAQPERKRARGNGGVALAGRRRASAVAGGDAEGDREPVGAARQGAARGGRRVAGGRPRRHGRPAAVPHHGAARRLRCRKQELPPHQGLLRHLHGCCQAPAPATSYSGNGRKATSWRSSMPTPTSATA